MDTCPESQTTIRQEAADRIAAQVARQVALGLQALHAAGIAAFHRANGHPERKICLIPTSAHGGDQV